MRNRAFMMLGFALVLGVSSVALVRNLLEGKGAGGPSDPPLPVTTIVVARTALTFGNRINREHLQEVTWPQASVPPGAFGTIEEVLGVSGGEDRVVLKSMEPSEPILASKVSGLGGRATLSTIIAADMRAVTIRVNDVNGVAGFVLPGDHVDVMITRELERDTHATTDVLLQNVKVLGIDQEASDRKDKPQVARAVTLEVTPEQAQRITLAQQVGTLGLALRNHTDALAAQVRTITLSDLKSGPSPQAQPPIAPLRPVADPGFSVRILRGTVATNHQVTREAR